MNLLQGDLAILICSTADQDAMSTLGTESIDDLEKGFRVFCRDHRFEELSLAVTALKVAMCSRDTDGCKSIFLGRESQSCDKRRCRGWRR